MTMRSEQRPLVFPGPLSGTFFFHFCIKISIRYMKAVNACSFLAHILGSKAGLRSVSLVNKQTEAHPS